MSFTDLSSSISKNHLILTENEEPSIKVSIFTQLRRTITVLDKFAAQIPLNNKIIQTLSSGFCQK